jgi:hypothetical protein
MAGYYPVIHQFRGIKLSQSCRLQQLWLFLEFCFLVSDITGNITRKKWERKNM